MKLKQLIWDRGKSYNEYEYDDENNVVGTYEVPGIIRAVAPVTGKIYTIVWEDGKYQPLWSADPGTETEEELMASAQKDFETAIMEAFDDV
jgi:hypothetical protein